MTDENGDLVPGATVMLDDGNAGERLTTVANDNGEFEFANLKPGVSYHATVKAPGFVDWSSPTFTLAENEYFFVKDIALRAVAEATSVTVSASPVEIATEQVHLEEQQRVMGFIPNFYVVYDGPNAAPMTAKLKFQMAFRAMTDPITFL
ncbi:MAG TPA: carboxypeptidase-like regulatory domain-containing protein, partial [Terracidiphilus sp.]|nr:carboxypeptidase-like regulatory domain-containing protein [Terracidiphilus sp.]